MKKVLIGTFISFVCVANVLAQSTKKALFIGNSYTYFNNMPALVNDIANSFSDTLDHDSNTPGGATAAQHAANTITQSKIAQGDWDYIIIQCQSQEPSFSPGQVATQTYPYILELDSLIDAQNSCAETLFFMTWGRKNGDASNCAVYPPICTYDGMQQRLRDSYLEFTDSTSASCSPVGVAWKRVRNTYPAINLYTADESHPSLHGSYLAACVFYSSMFKKSSVGSTFIPNGITATEAAQLQGIASSVVLDSLENWQQFGNIPDADFSFTMNQNQFTFTNNSKRFATSNWFFNDGSAVNNSTNPTHTFPATGGNYTVCLEVLNACGKKDSFCQTVVVQPLSISYLNKEHKLFFTKHFIRWSADLSLERLLMYNLNGQLIREYAVANQQEVSILNIPPGYYIIKARDKQGKTLIQRLVK